MQVKRTEISPTNIKLTIELGLEELTHAKTHELQEQAKNVKVAGFRKGKAPLSVVEKQIDQNQLQANIINHAINDYYGRAIEEGNIRTLKQPEVKILKFVPYTELEFEAEVEVMPKIKLGDYTKIKKKTEKQQVSAKEVDDVINNLRERMAEKKESTVAAKNGDEVIIDFEGTDNKGNKVAGATGTDYSLVLGSNTFIPGFETGLVGVKNGDKKDLKLKFPKDYHAKDLAGSDIIFSVTVKKVQTVELPKLDDEFAKKVGPFETVAQLKDDIKKQLLDQKQQDSLNTLKDEIVEELVKKSTLVLPQVLVEDQIAMIEQDFLQNLVYRGITKDEYLKQQSFKSEEEWKEKELKPQAERRVSVGMVLSEVADSEKIEVSEEELEQRIARYKREYQQSADQFDTPEMRREVVSRLLTEKTVDRLVEIATK